MFVTNFKNINNAYVCGKIKAEYLIKHYNIKPFSTEGRLYYFIINNSNNIELPWYIKIMK